MFDPAMAQDSIKKDEPLTEEEPPRGSQGKPNGGSVAASEPSQSVNINVASTSQFGGQEESKETPRDHQNQNPDLDLVQEQRPQTAPVAGAMVDDWPATDKEE